MFSAKCPCTLYHQLLDLWMRANPSQKKPAIEEKVTAFWKLNRCNSEAIATRIAELRQCLEDRKFAFRNKLLQGGGYQKRCLKSPELDDEISIEYEHVVDEVEEVEEIGELRASQSTTHSSTSSCDSTRCDGRPSRRRPAADRLKDEINSAKDVVDALRNIAAVGIPLSIEQKNKLFQAEKNLDDVSAKRARLDRNRKYQQKSRVRRLQKLDVSPKRSPSLPLEDEGGE